MGIPAPTREPSRPGPRGLRWGTALLALACFTLTGCAADFNAETNQVYQPAVGISDRNQAVYVLNALVVADGNGNGTLVGTLLNQAKTPDALVSVDATNPAGGKIQTTALAEPVTLAPRQAIKLETDAAVRLTGDGVVPGDYVAVAFTFQQAAQIQLEIPVVPRGPIYTGIPVGPVSSGPTPGGSTPTSSSPPPSSVPTSG